jgi:hypothetical protein
MRGAKGERNDRKVGRRRKGERGRGNEKIEEEGNGGLGEGRAARNCWVRT